MTLLRRFTFLFGSQTVIVIIPLFWIYFFLLMLVFVLQWLSLHWVILIMLSQFPLNFHHRKYQVKPHSSPWSSAACTAAVVHRNHFFCFYDYSHVDWDSLFDHLRDVPWEYIFILGASDAASEFCGWVQVGIEVYIPHRKYQVKPHSFPWFSAACTAAVVYRNHFFCLYQKDKSSYSKVKSRQASNCCKMVLEPAKLAYANKTKRSITSQKIGSQDFWWIANSVLSKGKSAISPLFNCP